MNRRMWESLITTVYSLEGNDSMVVIFCLVDALETVSKQDVDDDSHVSAEGEIAY